MFCGGVVRFAAISLSMAAAFSRMSCATSFHLESWSCVIASAAGRSLIRCSTVSPFVSVAPAAAGFCGAAACASRIAALVAVSARAAFNGLASIVAPINAAIATERAKGAVVAIGWVKDDMVIPFLDFWQLVSSPFASCERLHEDVVEIISSVSPRKILTRHINYEWMLLYHL